MRLNEMFVSSYRYSFLFPVGSAFLPVFLYFLNRLILDSQLKIICRTASNF